MGSEGLAPLPTLPRSAIACELLELFDQLTGGTLVMINDKSRKESLIIKDQ